jgi:pimeloyl-ACP methyl ester carboxylesterase
MGGAVAQQMALHRPDRVAGLILMGTGSKLPIDPTLPQRIVEATEKTVDWIVDWSWDVHAPPSFKMLSRQRLLEVSPQVLQGDYLACQAFDVRDQLDRIAVPALVICAAEDRMVKPKFGMTLAERIPNARLVLIEQAGHMFPVEKASLVAQAVLAWFAEQGWSAPCAG